MRAKVMWYWRKRRYVHQWALIGRWQQNKLVMETFAEQKVEYAKAGWRSEGRYPLWPALALPTGDMLEEEHPYEVDYACGVVFNNKAVDLEKIDLPYN